MDRLIASPYAKRLAKEQGIDLARLTGSGPNGRIIARDIEGAPKQPPTATTAAAPQALSDETILALYEPDGYDRVEHSTMARMIAEKLTQAKATIPHFYLTVDCELDALLATRKKVNAASPSEGPDKFRVSVNDFLIKAMALALQKVPKATRPGPTAACSSIRPRTSGWPWPWRRAAFTRRSCAMRTANPCGRSPWR
ncbi:Dihydrolipoyllysine-residue acetyltransferase component of pyruvate dehydrogenase complex [Methyloligella halotolerans]|uniref:Dihydrolipoyllysine-residue acetyltransferase component of pyruvate dehydrogenase complex n=1 Tax=Methyloligella halotolerans TaxID=1177755 RepID=A0A1E2S230_9HYPH|nr:Dihydrolipoyllysine-residue acetyltransferase component of pyruvate dehydrogenase complex [Methyloligella halotolerans]